MSKKPKKPLPESEQTEILSTGVGGYRLDSDSPDNFRVFGNEAYGQFAAAAEDRRKQREQQD